jgi:HSP20 family molecular chaperone IbpA
VNLPQAVNPQQARAEYRHGTCRVHLPKKPPPERASGQAFFGVEAARCVLRVAVL